MDPGLWTLSGHTRRRGSAASVTCTVDRVARPACVCPPPAPTADERRPRSGERRHPGRRGPVPRGHGTRERALAALARGLPAGHAPGEPVARPGDPVARRDRRRRPHLGLHRLQRPARRRRRHAPARRLLRASRRRRGRTQPRRRAPAARPLHGRAAGRHVHRHGDRGRRAAVALLRGSHGRPAQLRLHARAAARALGARGRPRPHPGAARPGARHRAGAAVPHRRRAADRPRGARSRPARGDGGADGGGARRAPRRDPQGRPRAPRLRRGLRELALRPPRLALRDVGRGAQARAAGRQGGRLVRLRPRSRRARARAAGRLARARHRRRRRGDDQGRARAQRDRRRRAALEPNLVEPLRKRWAVLGFDARTLVHAKDNDVLEAVSTGPTLLTRFDGEWW